MTNWHEFVERLRSKYPPGTNTFDPPLTPDEVNRQLDGLGQPPGSLLDMLACMNGAVLFEFDGSELCSLFGVSPAQPPEWSVDRYTRAWRKAGTGRNADWVIGITSYGVVFILRDGEVLAWNTATAEWDRQPMPLGEWFDDLLREADQVIRKLHDDG